MPTCLPKSVTAVDGRSAVLKKLGPRNPPPPPPPPTPPPTSPKLKSPRPPATKRLGSETSGLTSSSDRIHLPTPPASSAKGGIAPKAPIAPTLERKKSKKLSSPSSDRSSIPLHQHLPAAADQSTTSSTYSVLTRSYSSSLITEAPGSIAAGRREQVALQCAQRKMKIAHYGRSKSAKYESTTSLQSSAVTVTPTPLDATLNITDLGEKRCSFITPNSDPLYVAYHDEEWGVPVQDDKKLFELLVLSGAQVGSDWTSILKKRRVFRSAFAEFDAEEVARFSEKQITAISAEYGIDIARTRGVVDNANRILEVKRETGSFHKYVWGFVNHKPISPHYKFSHKIPVKTSKSESISKDLQRRGFRFVGPTVVHSFMQAAGLTNDHLVACYRHPQCAARAPRDPSICHFDA